MSIGGRKGGWVEEIVRTFREFPVPLHDASLTGTIQSPFDRQVTPTTLRSEISLEGNDN